ncbi:MAG: hypothetical protein JSU83_06080 [Deltaproteobacteria bacterium]|nr:MAG: hypothetical protein JSU83_06080 [Deltaproteobacteria bacterium]
MKKNLLRCAFFISIIFLCSPTAASEETYLFKFEPPNKNCPHGLHQQPNGGPYSVFVFCDDAGGTNIGIILTEPGAGPGKLEIPGPIKMWYWHTYDRFWQERQWAADITSFAWSPSFKYAYVATSFIYGDGGIFKLDLINRKAHEIILIESSSYDRKSYEHGSVIKSIDLDKKKLKISSWLYDHKLKKVVEFEKEIPLE